MKTATEIKAGILNHLNDLSGEMMDTTDLLDCYAENTAEEKIVGGILKELRFEDKIRLIATSGAFNHAAEDLDRVYNALGIVNEYMMSVVLA